MNIAISTRHRKPSSRKSSEEGYILVAVMFMLAILIIAMSVAAPKIAKEIQRDRELETMHRGKQYARAVKLYYKQFGAYPPNVDALVKTNEIRFLRKKYIDPTTGKDEWKVIHLGENKAPTAFGFFGVPLSAGGMGGGLCGNALPSSTSSSSSSSFGSSSSFSSGSSGSSFGSSFGSSSPTTGPTAGCPPTAASGSSSGSVTDPNASNASTDPNAAAGSSDSSGSNGSSTPGTTTVAGTASGTAGGTGTGLTGQTFGGIGIMGFSPNSPKQSILVYKKKNHYNEWEFVYDPLADQMMMQGGNVGGNGLTGSNPAGTSTFGGATTGPGSSGGSSFGGSSFGGSTFGGGSSTGPGSGGSGSQPQQ
jgi:type II secretory pathway pseudopilin PulG